MAAAAAAVTPAHGHAQVFVPGSARFSLSLPSAVWVGLGGVWVRAPWHFMRFLIVFLCVCVMFYLD